MHRLSQFAFSLGILYNLVRAQDICVCSPTQYSFRLDLSSDCDSSTITENLDGIAGSLCFFGGAPTGIVGPNLSEQVYDFFQAMRRNSAQKEGPNDFSNKMLEQILYSGHNIQISPITEVTSILFLEVDTTPELNIINQDSTYFSTNLPDESVVTFTSVSGQLDYTVPLGDQMEYVPGGVVVVLFGNDEEGNVIQNTVAWDYDGGCDSEPLEVGDTIGWIVVDDYAPAKAAFCPVVDAPPPTPAPEFAIVTEAPTPAPIDPIVTEAPTPAPIDSTETSSSPSNEPTNIPSMSPSNFPSEQPSANPSAQPSNLPSISPSNHPTISPSTPPSESPSEMPSTRPSPSPSESPSNPPSSHPTKYPSNLPSLSPSRLPSVTPSDLPSYLPSRFPSNHPTINSSVAPSEYPSGNPSEIPSMSPTSKAAKWGKGGKVGKQ